MISKRGILAAVSIFELATSVDASGAARLDPEGTVHGNPNGGYLLALMARAATAAAGGHPPHRIAASATYVSPPTPGDGHVAVDVLRQGRAASQVRARLTQGDAIRVETLFTLGTLEPVSADAQ